MRAGPRWPDQDPTWDGRDPRYGGYDMPGAGRAGRPRPGDGMFGYQQGAPPRAYGFQDQPGGHETARPGVNYQHQVRRPGDVAAGDGQAGRPADGRAAGRARKTGPPAALPPGPSASSSLGSGHEPDALSAVGRDPARDPAAEPTSVDRAERSAHPAGQAWPDPAASDGQPDRPARPASSAPNQSAAEPQASAATAAARPSPTGILPPAVTEAGSSPPVVSDSHAGGGYEAVGPDDETTPMAVILGHQPPSSQRFADPTAAQAGPPRSAPSPPSVQRIRGPFEPPAKSDPVEYTPPPAAEPESGPADSTAETAASQPARASVWSPTSEKMDQIKDLYLTAEAIGEDALDKHFQLVSDRQRQLIREYFDHVSSVAESSDAAS